MIEKCFKWTKYSFNEPIIQFGNWTGELLKWLKIRNQENSRIHHNFATVKGCEFYSSQLAVFVSSTRAYHVIKNCWASPLELHWNMVCLSFHFIHASCISIRNVHSVHSLSQGNEMSKCSMRITKCKRDKLCTPNLDSTSYNW